MKERANVPNNDPIIHCRGRKLPLIIQFSGRFKPPLQQNDIKITELAKYLQISRPTMYKYIECYDLGQEELVDKQIAKLFDYISKNDLID